VHTVVVYFDLFNNYFGTITHKSNCSVFSDACLTDEQ